MRDITMDFKVTTARLQQGDITALLDGKPVQAVASRLEVGLVSADGEQSLLLRLPVVPTAELEAQRATFAPDSTVRLRIETQAVARTISPPATDAERAAVARQNSQAADEILTAGVARATPGSMPPIEENEGRVVTHPGTGETMTAVQPAVDDAASQPA